MVSASKTPIKEEPHLGFTPEFMSVVVMHKGTCERFDVEYVNNMFNLPCEDDEHESFASSLTSANRNKILADLCEDGTHWIVATKGSQSVKRVALKSQARGQNHFLKVSLILTSHNDTISEERMVLLHSIITGKKIIIGKIIVNKTFNCIETDKALAVNGTVILAATWRQLTKVESKEMEKEKMNEPTPKEPTPANLLMLLPSIA
ncbi:hypothetical protein V6N11_058425 [Hibiscus sabdariffa]|uniref:Putative plant transposon protein domain-containing protein n=1 Tax=Hibiscus sabdariffa TaxID=183260 RepID=A0ABR2U4H6_9ROSI